MFFMIFWYTNLFHITPTEFTTVSKHMNSLVKHPLCQKRCTKPLIKTFISFHCTTLKRWWMNITIKYIKNKIQQGSKFVFKLKMQANTSVKSTHTQMEMIFYIYLTSSSTIKAKQTILSVHCNTYSQNIKLNYNCLLTKTLVLQFANYDGNRKDLIMN